MIPSKGFNKLSDGTKCKKPLTSGMVKQKLSRYSVKICKFIHQNTENQTAAVVCKFISVNFEAPLTKLTNNFCSDGV
jgi:hypothetical protein